MDRMADPVSSAREPHAKTLLRAFLEQMVLGVSRAVLQHEMVDLAHDDFGRPLGFQPKGAEGTGNIEEQDLFDFKAALLTTLKTPSIICRWVSLAVTMSPITTLLGQGGGVEEQLRGVRSSLTHECRNFLAGYRLRCL